MKQLYHIITLLMLLVAGAESQAQIFYKAVTINVGSTTDIVLDDTYVRTLRNATNVSYRWWTSSSSISIQSRGMTSCNIKGVSPDTKVRLNFDCSYLYDGYPRTMNFYWEITVRGGNVSVTDIELSRAVTSMFVGETLQLSATPYPLDATNRRVNWSSDNNDIASVSSSGLVTARSEGYVRIWVRAADGGGAANYCSLTVKASETVKVDDITLSESSRELQIGESFSLTATIKPDNVTNKALAWATSNPQVATVAGGLVTATGEGECDIVCTSTDGSRVSSMCHVKVISTPSETGAIKIERIILNTNEIALDIGAFYELYASVLPKEATDTVLRWESSNRSVAIVENGYVIAVNPGQCFIFCRATDGSEVYELCRVQINEGTPDPLTKPSVSLSAQELIIDEGDDSHILTATVFNCNDASLIWESSNPEIAIVDNGHINALHYGSTTIKCTLENSPQVFATCHVKVNYVRPTVLVGQISIRDSYHKCIFVGDTVRLSARAYPANAADPTFRWESDQPQIASVDEDGRVIAHAKGSTIVWARANDAGEASSYCIIDVTEPVLPCAIKLSTSSIHANVDRSRPLLCEVLPANATNKDVIWTSSDPDVAVYENGKIRTLSYGRCIITCTAVANSEIKQQCVVRVRNNATHTARVILPEGAVSMYIEELDSLNFKVMPRNDNYKVHSVSINKSPQEIADSSNADFEIPWIDGRYDIRVVFQSNAQAGNANVNADDSEPHITLENCTVKITGRKSEDTIRVYDTSGRLITATKNDSITLPPGAVYIMRIGRHSYKFAL